MTKLIELLPFAELACSNNLPKTLHWALSEEMTDLALFEIRHLRIDRPSQFFLGALVCFFKEKFECALCFVERIESPSSLSKPFAERLRAQLQCCVFVTECSSPIFLRLWHCLKRFGGVQGEKILPSRIEIDDYWEFVDEHETGSLFAPRYWGRWLSTARALEDANLLYDALAILLSLEESGCSTGEEAASRLYEKQSLLYENKSYFGCAVKCAEDGKLEDAWQYFLLAEQFDPKSIGDTEPIYAALHKMAWSDTHRASTYGRDEVAYFEERASCIEEMIKRGWGEAYSLAWLLRYYLDHSEKSHLVAPLLDYLRKSEPDSRNVANVLAEEFEYHGFSLPEGSSTEKGLKIALRFNPVCYKALLDLAIIFLESGRYSDAANYATMLMALEEKQWDALLPSRLLCEALCHLGRVKEAYHFGLSISEREENVHVNTQFLGTIAALIESHNVRDLKTSVQDFAALGMVSVLKKRIESLNAHQEEETGDVES